MAEYTAVAQQTVQPNQDLIFTDTPIKGKCSILHRQGSGLITLRGLSCHCKTRFKIFFNSNIGTATTAEGINISLAIAIDGEPVPSTNMVITPAAANTFTNIASSVYVDVPEGCCVQISVRNTSTLAVEVINANLIVERVC